MAEKVQHRLAAVIAADVAGYSRLMRLDEEATMAAWWSYRKEVIDPTVADHGGRIVKLTGDGFLAEFSSATSAVSAAIAIQSEIASRAADQPSDRRVEFRMGVNLGDILWDDEDIYGDGVNIAARIEALAEPGGILISSSIYDQVHHRVSAGFEDLGEQSLKNIDTPLRVYRVRDGDKVPKPKAELKTEHPTILPLPDKPSIAVLPFDNMSGDPEQEFFADGITEDIITALSRSPWLFIIARNTTFTFKGQKIDVKQVARELGVRYVLEGSVRTAGNRIRVTAQLIDGTTGGHIWSERYDGQLADIFDLQDEITRNVVGSIQTQVQLTAGGPVERSKRPDLTVWELTMRAWSLLYDFTPESFTTAKALLEQALVHDPNSAEAHFILSLIHHHTALLQADSDYLPSATKARSLARRATTLDNHNEYAHWALGICCMVLAKHEEAISALERAVELNPNCSVAYGSLGTALCLVGRIDEAIEKLELAIRSNPRDPSIFFRFTGLGLAHYQAGRFDTAAEWAGKAVHHTPQWYLGHYLLAASHVRMGNDTTAKAVIERCQEALPEASIEQLNRMPLKDAAAMEDFRNCLRKAGLPG